MAERSFAERQLGRVVWGLDVERYHTMRTIRTESVGHHTAMVALLASLVTPETWSWEEKHNLLLACLRHDLGEGAEVPCGTALGDVPSPTKRLVPGLKAMFDEVEDRRCAEVGLGMPALTPEAKRILKFADNMAGLIYAVQELTLGHNGIRSVYYAYRSYIVDLGCEGAERVLFDIVQTWWEEAAFGPLWSREGEVEYERK